MYLEINKALTEFYQAQRAYTTAKQAAAIAEVDLDNAKAHAVFESYERKELTNDNQRKAYAAIAVAAQTQEWLSNQLNLLEAERDLALARTALRGIEMQLEANEWGDLVDDGLVEAPVGQVSGE